MGREGDLFKDLDPIMEEPVLELDPMTVVSMISSGEDITTQSTNVSDISSIQSGHLLSEVFYGESINSSQRFGICFLDILLQLLVFLT